MRRLIAGALAGATTTVALLGFDPIGLHPAGAEAGCDDGENTGATKFIAANDDWTNTSDAWRYYARLTPAGTSSLGENWIIARDSSGGQIKWSIYFEEGGVWNSNYSRLSSSEQMYNRNSTSYTYFYKRSCTKV